MNTCAPLTLLTLLALAGPGRADDDAIKKEVAKLQGAWQLEAMEMDGEKRPPEVVAKGRLIITGDKFTLKEGDKVAVEGTFKVVAVKGKSRQTDLYDGGARTLLTIAEWLDDDTFRTCARPGERPTEYTSTKQNGQIVMVYKRVTAK
jgi:uncharacterized protein (TIGR03067 family)